ncbi:MAG: VWA domain-containing protein, partial [Candidatus Kapaibacterium sp.]
MTKAILLFLLLPMLASAQYFDVFDIDTSEYPIMKAKFYSIDANGKQIVNHSNTDFEITENADNSEIIRVSCPISSVEPFSVVIALDVSSSMRGEWIKSAISACKSFIDLVPGNGSEIAIIAFNTKNHYISDFTTNKSQLKLKIENLLTSGGTDFDAAFLNPLAGSLLAIEKAKHRKKSVVLITDGHAKGNEIE